MARIRNSRRRKVDVLELQYPNHSSTEKKLGSNNKTIIDVSLPLTYEGNDTVDTPTMSLSQLNSVSQDMPDLVSEECDACPYCADICADPLCDVCIQKQNRYHCIEISRKSQQSSELMSFPFFGHGKTEHNVVKHYTSCQIRRHCNESSAWLVCGDNIYDATKFIETHPGGRLSILRKAGGVADCSIDMSFHSKGGQKLWKNCLIGKVRTCTGPLGEEGRNCEGDQCIIS
jgi:cytochrome b involved in lipid metabolism